MNIGQEFFQFDDLAVTQTTWDSKLGIEKHNEIMKFDKVKNCWSVIHPESKDGRKAIILMHNEKIRRENETEF